MRKKQVNATVAGWPMKVDTFPLKHLKVPVLLRNNCQIQGLHFPVPLGTRWDHVTRANQGYMKISTESYLQANACVKPLITHILPLTLLNQLNCWIAPE